MASHACALDEGSDARAGERRGSGETGVARERATAEVDDGRLWRMIAPAVQAGGFRKLPHWGSQEAGAGRRDDSRWELPLPCHRIPCRPYIAGGPGQHRPAKALQVWRDLFPWDSCPIS